jgi:hypothetical protein
MRGEGEGEGEREVEGGQREGGDKSDTRMGMTSRKH